MQLSVWFGRNYSRFISSIDIFQSSQKIYWENKFIRFSGYPFIIAGQKWLNSHHGKDRNIRSKEKRKCFAFGNTMGLLSIVVFLLRDESHIDFRTQCVIMTLAGGRIIANDALKKRKVIEIQSSWIAIYYKIYFRVQLQTTCADYVSVVIVVDK